MKITRRSLVSGKLHTLDLPVTEAELQAYEGGALLQDAFPDLAAPLREFIKTGVTPEEWEAQVLGKVEARPARLEDSIKVIGRFRRKSDDYFVGYIDVPEEAGDDGHLRCLIVQADPELDDDDGVLEVIWRPVPGRLTEG